MNPFGDIIDIVDEMNTEPFYEPDMRDFKVSIEYKGRVIERKFQYDNNLEQLDDNEMMVSTMGDVIADNLEDMLNEVTK